MRYRMNEAKRAGMKGLTRTNLKTIGHELAVGSRIDPPENLVAAIAGIGKERMADMFHVGADLMCSARFENAFHKTDRP